MIAPLIRKRVQGGNEYKETGKIIIHLVIAGTMEQLEPTKITITISYIYHTHKYTNVRRKIFIKQRAVTAVNLTEMWIYQN